MSILLRTDVSAVKIFKDFILAGIGSSLHVFSKTSNKLFQKVPCLKGQKIYGFVPSEDGSKILIFGGKQFIVISVTSTEATEGVFVCLFEAEVCDDWLHSAIWVDNDIVALLTAHNVVQIWNTSKPCMSAQYPSRENSILYSGLLLPLRDDVLVLAGTVFSEVIIHGCKTETPLHFLKGHRGVIFSISCDPQKKIIVTTSDDRSVRIWGINNTKWEYDHTTIEFWKKSDIVCRHEVYGHTARVMRNYITNDIVISVGEDSAICFWDLQGILLKKIFTHQNGGIWSVDAAEKHLVTGGGDSGVILHPLTIATESGQSEILDIGGTPKKIVFTARQNIVLLNEKDELVHYDIESKTKTVYKLQHDSSYKLLSLSFCKQMIAVADMSGNLDVFVENCKQEALLLNIINSKLEVGKILSLHWAGNRHLVLCCEGGKIVVIASRKNHTELYEDFLLPPSKERWLTASAIDMSSSIFIVGDRCGNIHIYMKGSKSPIKSFGKVHGRYGPTSITIKKNEFMSTGRDGTVKYFVIDNQERITVRYMSSKDLEFQWVEKFIDKNENIICGFQERVFVVYDIKKLCKLVEVPCGGGHRTWDATRYFDKINNEYAEYIKFVYVKNAEVHIHTFEVNKIVSSCIVNGSHSKEINCLKIYKSELGQSATFCISGGEDTTVRVSSINSRFHFQDEIVFKHLSNVRTLKTKFLSSNRVLLVTAGGRAQICIKLLEFLKENDQIIVKSQDLLDYLIKGTERERKGKQSWKNCSIDFDPETRIMDVDLLETHENNFILIAGCSDAYLRIFNFDMKNVILKLLKEVKHKTCILKTLCIKLLNKDIVLTCTTRGEVIFFNVTGNLEELEVDQFFRTTTNKSGINSLATRIISDNQLVFATGGDDNAIHINLLKIPDVNNLNSAVIHQSWSTDKFHCSQITGILLLENVLVSTSIDQRVTLSQWRIENDGIKCEYLSQTYSDVADIQGMDFVDHSSKTVTVCVFGKGLEIIEIATHS